MRRFRLAFALHQSGPTVRVFQHGCAVEASVHLYLREQQVRNGDVCGASVRQHRLLQERRLHPRHQGESPLSSSVLWVTAEVRATSCSAAAVRCSRRVRTETRTGRGGACPGSCRCEHPSSCLVLVYDTADKPERQGRSLAG